MFDKDGGEAERWRGEQGGKTQRRSGMSHQLGEMYERLFEKGGPRCKAAGAWEEWEEVWTKGEVPGISRLAPALASRSLSGLLCEYKPGFWRAVG